MISHFIPTYHGLEESLQASETFDVRLEMFSKHMTICKIELKYINCGEKRFNPLSV